MQGGLLKKHHHHYDAKNETKVAWWCTGPRKVPDYENGKV